MLIALFVYVALQLLIGVLVSRRIKTEDDYLVAGRSLGPTLAAVSIFATWFGAETCVGAAGTMYSEGLTRVSVEPFAYGLCLICTGLFFSAAFWRTGITTLADLFLRRYGRSVEKVAAVLLIPTSVFWAAAQIRAFGHVLAIASEGWLGDEVGIAVAAAVAIVYTVFGGLLADVITDVIQGGLLVIGLIVLLVAVVLHLGGPAAAWQHVPERIHLLSGDQPGLFDTMEAWALPILGSVVAQEVISRCLAARSPRVARRATLTGGGIYLLVGLVPVTLGLLGPTLAPGLEDGEQLLPHLARELLHPVLFLVFAGALISAILSTVDSALLVASAVLSRNVLLGSGRPAGQRTRLLLARGGVVVCGLCATVLAYTVESVALLVEEASGFGSAGIFIIATLGLFTRLGSAWAGNACLLMGGGAWILGRYLLPSWEVEVAHPYLWSLLAAAVGFGGGLSAEAWVGRGRPPPG